MIRLAEKQIEEVEEAISVEKILNAYDDAGDYIGYKGYKKFVYSVFDHWLTREEFEAYMVNVPENIEYERKRKRFGFFEFVFNTGAFFYREYNDDELNFSHYELFKFSTYDQFKQKCLYGLQDRENFFLICPSLKLIAQAYYDEVDVVYMKDKKTIQIVEEQAKNCGLYLLDDPTR